MHQQQHALFAAYAQRTQAGCYAAHALVELAVTQGTVVVYEGGLFRARGVFTQQVLGEVEDGGQCCRAFSGGVFRHGVSPRYGFMWEQLN